MNHQDGLKDFAKRAAGNANADFLYKFASSYLINSEFEGNYTPISSYNTSAVNYLRALHWMAKAAELGHAQAQYSLGRLYNVGWRANERDVQKSIKWNKKAALQGHAGAIHVVAESFLEQDNYEKALENYSIAAEKGNESSQVRLGEFYSLYCEEMGVPKDNAKAIFWFQKAAELKNGEACYWLAWHYFDGEGAEKDLNKAKYWAIKANEELSTSATLGLISTINAELDDLSEEES